MTSRICKSVGMSTVLVLGLITLSLGMTGAAAAHDSNGDCETGNHMKGNVDCGHEAPDEAKEDFNNMLKGCAVSVPLGTAYGGPGGFVVSSTGCIGGGLLNAHT